MRRRRNSSQKIATRAAILDFGVFESIARFLRFSLHFVLPNKRDCPTLAGCSGAETLVLSHQTQEDCINSCPARITLARTLRSYSMPAFLRPCLFLSPSIASLKSPSTASTLSSTYQFGLPRIIHRPGVRAMSATAPRPDPFRPAKRVAGQRQDVW